MLGNRVEWINDVPFGEYRRHFYWSLPYYQPYCIRAEDLRPLLYRGALGVLGVSMDKSPKRTATFCISHSANYDFPSLHAKKRNQTRRGLERCEIRRVDWDEMRRSGLDINLEALIRQKRHSSRLGNKEWWDRQCTISAQFPDVQAWGAYVDGELAAYVHVILNDGQDFLGKSVKTADIVHAMSSSKHLKHYPNEALFFTVTRELLTSNGCQQVMLGSGSDDPNLLQWKRHMGYSTEPVGYHLVANPALHIAKLFIPKLRIWMDGTMLGARKTNAGRLNRHQVDLSSDS